MEKIQYLIPNTLITHIIPHDISQKDCKSNKLLVNILSSLLSKYNQCNSNVYYLKSNNSHYVYINDLLYKICYYIYPCGNKQPFGILVLVKPHGLIKIKCKQD